MASLIHRKAPLLLGRIAITSNRSVGSTRQYVLSITRAASSSNQSRKSSILAQQEKTEYEIELDRIIDKEKYKESFGFYEDEPILDKFLFHSLMLAGVSLTCVFGFAMLFYAPDVRGMRTAWRTREAYIQIEERRRKGLPLIDRNFAPPELIEKMVPPPGDWEKEWLLSQPTTRPSQSSWYAQDFTYP